jgi:hypothetical protein
MQRFDRLSGVAPAFRMYAARERLYHPNVADYHLLPGDIHCCTCCRCRAAYILVLDTVDRCRTHHDLVRVFWLYLLCSATETNVNSIFLSRSGGKYLMKSAMDSRNTLSEGGVYIQPSWNFPCLYQSLMGLVWPSMIEDTPRKSDKR